MTSNPWTASDMSIVSRKLQIYVLQLLLAKRLITLPEVQELVDQFLANIHKDPEGANGAKYAKLLLKELPGISLP